MASPLLHRNSILESQNVSSLDRRVVFVVAGFFRYFAKSGKKSRTNATLLSMRSFKFSLPSEIEVR